MTEETIGPTSEDTRPIHRGEDQAPREPTETLPGTKPDLPAVALLGSVAYSGSRIRTRIESALGPLWARGWNRVVLAAALGVVVVLLGVSLMSSGPGLVEVPDVRGRPYVEAGDLLRRQGLTTDPVSFAPARTGQAGLVMDTLPAAGSRVQSGTKIHMIAGAATPAPTPAPAPAPIVSKQHADTGGERGKGKGRDKDDG